MSVEPRGAARYTSAVISVRALRKNYGQLTAVEGLDLEIAPGEFFAFLGPNAAGKTTTIKMLAGLLKPTEGQVTIGGGNVEKLKELPPNCRRGDNKRAFEGGFRLWHNKALVI